MDRDFEDEEKEKEKEKDKDNGTRRKSNQKEVRQWASATIAIQLAKSRNRAA